jgi:hypothetical protein
VYLILPVILLAGIVGALVDIIRIDEGQVKHLPKVAWVLLVIFIPLIGIILWFALGREYTGHAGHGTFGDPRRWASAGSSTSTSTAQPVHDSRSTEQQLADLEREIEHYNELRNRRDGD